MDEEAFKKYIAQSVFESLMKDFPEQTINALKESLGDRASELGL